ncbi:MAG: PSD1 and planctomycete cytochrome C domain-containing protein [Chthoniobacteraceae bacterium]
MPIPRLVPVTLLAAAAVAHSATPERVDFRRDIRPVLSSKCFSCHGPDEKHRKAKLRLDVEAAAKKEVIVPGKPEESEVFLLISSKDEDEKMPPHDSGKSLTADEIELIRRWIAQGADYAEHWSFVAPVRAEPPKVQRGEWVRNAIDAFVLARLDREKLAPSPEAERTTLLRRLSFDLIGLPPTPAEVEAFVKDTSERAYETVVDRLLRSPAYGERWGRIWLDAARYADSNGYEKDSPREAWFYRDWVIGALNRDMPYDRFIIEQIAGDLLPNATQDQIVATGYLRNSMINEEGGVDPEQFRMAAMFDRMDAIGKGILGLTIQCAQCHTHKFDPIQHTDYYGLFAFLNNSAEGSMTVFTREQEKQRRKVLDGVRAIERDLQQQHPDWAARMAAWEKDTLAAKQPGWETLALTPNDTAASGQKFLPQPDGSYLAQSYSPAKTRPIFYSQSRMKDITAVRLEVMADPNLPHGGPGRSLKGLFALSEFEVRARPLDQAEPKLEKVKIASATADLALPSRPIDAKYVDPKAKKGAKPQVEGPIDFAIDGKAETAWGIDAGPGRRNVSHEAVFRFEKPLTFANGTALEIALSQQHGGYNNNDNHAQNLGRFRISVTRDAEARANPVPPTVRELLAIPAQKRTAEQTAAIFSHWRTTVPEFAGANQRIEALYAEFPEGHSQLVLNELANPRTTHRLDRGDFLSPKESVTPAVPAFLNPLPKNAPLNRLGFAKWLVSRESPTTARSLVNRVWQAYFGTGLFSTSEDLGSQGEMPVHPELLDWLAVEFMDHGWSLKYLHRLIATSATYRQSSRATSGLLARDPENRLLARGPRFRLGAEAIRDNALAASGLLNPKLGGPSVYPPAPKLLFEPPASYGYKTWNEATGPDRHRRALYTFQFRSAQFPGQQVFDAPTGEVSCVRRPNSNTPLQALTVLNEPLFVECAQALARATLADGGDTDAARLDFAFRRCVSRPPRAEESAMMLKLLRKQRDRLASGNLDATKLAGIANAGTDAAAWTAVARVLLNLDETLTKE